MIELMTSDTDHQIILFTIYTRDGLYYIFVVVIGDSGITAIALR